MSISIVSKHNRFKEKSAKNITARILLRYMVYCYECAICKDNLPNDKTREIYYLKGFLIKC